MVPCAGASFPGEVEGVHDGRLLASYVHIRSPPVAGPRSVPTSTVSLSSFFDLGTRSAARTFATRSSTFMKSSMEILADATAGAVAGEAAPGAGEVEAVPAVWESVTIVGSLRGQSGPSSVSVRSPAARQ